MESKKMFWLGILVMVLVFGMMFVGCDNDPYDDPYDDPDDDPIPNLPSLSGSVSLDNRYPVVSGDNTITASFEEGSSSPTGIATWKWYKTKEDEYSLSSVTLKTTLVNSGNTYTVTTGDVDYWIWAEVTYSGNSGTRSARTYSAVLGNPRLPLGSVEFDKNYPAIGETITASFRKNMFSSDPDPAGTASWLWFKTIEDKNSLSDVVDKTQLFGGSGGTYTVNASDEGFWIWAEVGYSGNSGTTSGRTSSTVIGIPAAATVSVSVDASRTLSSSIITILGGNHSVKVTLTLSDGRWNNVSYSTASQWLAITGTPSITSWTGLFSSPYVSVQGRKLVLSFQTNSDTMLPINLTVALNTSQLSTMRSSTNVYNTLTAGTPSTVSVSQWTILD